MEEISLEKIETLVRTAQTNVNDAHAHYHQAVTTLSREFVEIKLQLCIFQYDICIEMANVIRNQPTGFAVSVALKGLVLRLFEFHLTVNQHLYPRLKALAAARGIEIDDATVRQLKREWKTELTELQKWQDVRNKAAGHYDKDFPLQVELLEGLSYDHVMGVTVGFLHFSMAMLIILKDSGQGVAHDNRSRV